MKILDLSAGNRAVWMNKAHPDAIYLDKRAEMNPDIVCDTRSIPPEVGTGFNLVVFDPPHENFGKNGKCSALYGHHTMKEIKELIMDTGREAHRVSSPEALMAFKWNDHSIKLPYVLSLLSDFWEPLFGHWMRYGGIALYNGVNQTYWVMLRRRP